MYISMFASWLYCIPSAAQTVYNLDVIQPDVKIIGAGTQSWIDEAIVLDFDDSGAGDLFFRDSNRIYGYLDFSKNQTGRIVDVAEGNYNLAIMPDPDTGYDLGHSYILGDWNDDDIADLAISNQNAYQSGQIASGAVYVFWGGSKWQMGGVINLGEHPADIFVYNSDMSTDDTLGVDLATLDVNNDGIDDLAIGAQYGLNGLGYHSGAVYVVYGSESFTSPVEIDISQGQIDLTLQGRWYSDWFGTALAVGDVNGDDVDDLVVGAKDAWHEGPRLGAMYAFFGSGAFPPHHVIDLSLGAADVTVLGIMNYGNFGLSVTCGDFDGDGLDDMCAGENVYQTTEEMMGAAYLIRGSKEFLPGTLIDLRSEAADVSFLGEAIEGCGLGKYLSSGDLDGDGKDELCISAWQSRDCAEVNSGAHFIFSGGDTYPPFHVVDLNESCPTLKILGDDEGDISSSLYTSLTDLNGDGQTDILVGHGYADRPGSVDCGEIYIFYSNGLPIDRPPRILAGPGPSEENQPELRLWDPFYNAAGWSDRFIPFLTQGYGLNPAAGDLDGDGYDEILAGPGPGPNHPPRVLALDSAGEVVWQFQAYGTPRYGVNVCAGDLDGDGDDEVVTGAGPGAVYGPHVRGWTLNSGEIVPLGEVNYLAYGTHRWGVNVACGDIDGDGIEEIVTGAGPGVVFGPHVRGWDVDGGMASPISEVSFLAYGTPRWGVNVACGDIDGDGIAEIISGPGPSVQFGSHVRGWNYDGKSLESIDSVNFFPFPNIPHVMGCVVACGDLDNDRIDEILTVPGPHQDNPARLKSWNYDGETLTQIERMSFMVFEGGPYVAGARLAFGNFHQDPPFLP